MQQRSALLIGALPGTSFRLHSHHRHQTSAFSDAMSRRSDGPPSIWSRRCSVLRSVGLTPMYNRAGLGSRSIEDTAGITADTSSPECTVTLLALRGAYVSPKLTVTCAVPSGARLVCSQTRVPPSAGPPAGHSSWTQAPRLDIERRQPGQSHTLHGEDCAKGKYRTVWTLRADVL